MKPHRITEDSKTFMDGRKPGDAITLAMVHPAKQKDVDAVLKASPTSGEGRSPWVWVRLPNGDLLLGVFPQGDMYCEMEKAAQFPQGV